MGASQSTSNAPQTALHVLRITPGSPASETDIEPYFSFLVGYEGFEGEQSGSLDASELERIVEAHEGKTLNLHVWNSKYRETKVVPIVPSRTWSSSLQRQRRPDSTEATSQPSPSLLGLSVRLCEPEFAMDNVWHVLDVAEGSPAESAGLVPMGDWVLGWSGGVLSAENDFYDLVEAHVDKPLRVYVYSYDFDALREVVLIPNRHWGGDGLLGCVFGFGLLHRIPAQQQHDESQPIMPSELLDDQSDDGEELFVPAETLDSTMPYTPSQQPPWERSGPSPLNTSSHSYLESSEEDEANIDESDVKTPSSPVAKPSVDFQSASKTIETPMPKRPTPLSHNSSSPMRTPLNNGVGRVFSPPLSSRASPAQANSRRFDDDVDERTSEGSLTSVD